MMINGLISLTNYGLIVMRKMVIGIVCVPIKQLCFFQRYIVKIPEGKCHEQHCPFGKNRLGPVTGIPCITIYRHLPAVSGGEQAPLLINQPVGKGHLKYPPVNCHSY